jgi:TRAP-type C4-dicarboxylate transport system substrate-binding protein
VRALTPALQALGTWCYRRAENVLAAMLAVMFAAFIVQIVLTSHLVGFDLLTVSKKVWDDMGAEKQARFQAAADSAIAFSTEKHLAREKELVDLFKSKGLNVYAPDVAAFRKHAQEKYLASDLAKDWPAGMVDKINAL